MGDTSAPLASNARARIRSRRTRAVRPRTENIHRISRRHLDVLALESPPVDIQRPRTRGDCAHVVRPCPFVACKYSLYLEVSTVNGSIKLRFPDLGPEEMPAESSCVLDVADRGPSTIQEVADSMNFVRERARQIESSAFARLASHGERLRDLLERDEDADEDRNTAPMTPGAIVQSPANCPEPVAPPVVPAPLEHLEGMGNAHTLEQEPANPPSALLMYAPTPTEDAAMGAEAMNGNGAHHAAHVADLEPPTSTTIDVETAVLVDGYAQARLALIERRRAIAAQLAAIDLALSSSAPDDAAPTAATPAARKRPGRMPSPNTRRVFEYVSTHEGATTSGVAKALATDPGKVASILGALKSSGRLRTTGSRPTTWAALPSA